MFGWTFPLNVQKAILRHLFVISAPLSGVYLGSRLKVFLAEHAGCGTEKNLWKKKHPQSSAKRKRKKRTPDVIRIDVCNYLILITRRENERERLSQTRLSVVSAQCIRQGVQRLMLCCLLSGCFFPSSFCPSLPPSAFKSHYICLSASVDLWHVYHSGITPIKPCNNENLNYETHGWLTAAEIWCVI